MLDGGYEETGSIEGYDLYARRDGRRTLAVADGRLLFCLRGPSETGLGRVRTAIGAGRGEVRRYHEASDDFGAISDALGGRPWVWCHGAEPDDGLPDAVERRGTTFAATPEAVYFSEGFLFERTAAVDRGRVKSWLRDRDRPLQATRTDVRTSGRVVVADVHLTHEDWRGLRDGTPVRLPLVTWVPDGDPGDGVVRFHHVAGDPVDADRLSVRVNGEAVTPSVAGDRVGPGDTVAVDLDEPLTNDARLWFDQGNGSGAAIAGYRPGEDPT